MPSPRIPVSCRLPAKMLLFAKASIPPEKAASNDYRPPFFVGFGYDCLGSLGKYSA